MVLYLKLLLLIFAVVGAEMHKELLPSSGLIPKQIHIAFGEKLNDIVVSWSTRNDTKESVVLYGEIGINKKAIGYRKEFVDPQKKQKSQWLHKVVLKDLQYDTIYKYKCGSRLGFSNEFSFKTSPQGEDWAPNVIMFGDLGIVNHIALPFLVNETKTGKYDMILHVGDIAYEMFEQEGKKGDVFMNNIQPIAANLPYMTAVGNHEHKYDFIHYKRRFIMPSANEDIMYYSFKMATVHFIAIDTELYYECTIYHPETTCLVFLENQYNWLKSELEDANKNREKCPWIVLYGHRPMYCSNNDTIHCLQQRTRYGYNGKFGLETLLKDYGVDLVLWAHMHSYERLYPVYNETVYNGTTDPNNPYHNPRAPVHIISGSAGCQYKTDPFLENPPSWSAARNSDYGYARMKVYNRTHLYIEQLTVEKATLTRDGNVGTVVDSMWLIKDKHEPFYNLM